MRIFFLAEYCIPIHALSLQERPLGGTETALIHLARNLHERGHEVKVFTSHDAPPPSPPESPQYLPASALPLAGGCDVLVVVQQCTGVFHGVEAKKVLYWTGDGPEQFTTFGIGDERFKQRTDLILAVTNWHAQSLSSKSGFPVERIRVIRNAVVIRDFEEQVERVPHRLIYTSAPHRGLHLALNAFDVIRKSVQDAELHVFSGFELYDRERPFSGPQKAIFEDLKERCKNTEGCSLHGNILQHELAKEYLKSSLYLYPASVPETSCITAIEAKAAGCPAIVSSLGGLPETVGKGGIVISGEPSSEVFLQQFTSAALTLLNDKKAWAKVSSQAINEAKEHYSWNLVTDRFEASIASLFQSAS